MSRRGLTLQAWSLLEYSHKPLELSTAMVVFFRIWKNGKANLAAVCGWGEDS